jgi:hypothetical protein
MSNREVKSVSDYEWASSARWLVWFSDTCGLDAVSISKVYSFKIDQGGIDKLIRHKRLTLARVKSNKSKIEAAVGRMQDLLGEDEMVLARSVYRQYAVWERMLQEHVDRAKGLRAIRVAAKEKAVGFWSDDGGAK